MTMSNRDRIVLIRLIKMTTSEHDGEALNAIRLANKMLTTHGVSWEDVIDTARIPLEDKQETKWGTPDYPVPEPSRRRRKNKEHQHRAREILSSGKRMTLKEQAFLQDMLDWNYPTPSQKEWLDDLYKRYVTAL